MIKLLEWLRLCYLSNKEPKLPLLSLLSPLWRHIKINMQANREAAKRRQERRVGADPSGVCNGRV